MVVPNHSLRTLLVRCRTTAQQHTPGFNSCSLPACLRHISEQLVRGITKSWCIVDTWVLFLSQNWETKCGTWILLKSQNLGALNYILMVCCALAHFCRVHPCTKRIDGELAFEILFRDAVQVYERLVELYSDNDIRLTSDEGYWRGLLSRTGVRVDFGIPSWSKHTTKGQGLGEINALHQLDLEFTRVH